MATEEGFYDPATFAQQPPIPKNYFVQKLATPTSSGKNLILSIQYYHDDELADEIAIYQGGTQLFTIKDDGVYPDAVEHDYKYSVLLETDLNKFRSIIQDREDQITNQGGVYHFTGHDGEFTKANDIVPFDMVSFNNNIVQPIYSPILDITNCDQAILKQNSLLITHLGVVEDYARTYCVKNGNGNLVGAWTFGNLMKNMINTNHTNITARDFLKTWVKTWRTDQRIGSFASPSNYDYENVKGRGKVIEHLIEPWIRLAYTGSATLPSVIDENNWESIWDNLDDNQLLQKAPFKLMAIVNRLDIRANAAYSGSLNNAGETRFIYTLINPITGNPPLHNNIKSGYGPNTPGAIDWIGMNVILEYGNPFHDLCELQSFGQQWYDLSSYNLEIPSEVEPYNESLQAITDQIIKRDVGGEKNWNRSALNQLRTNERIFEGPNGIGTGTQWDTPDWELRQFELSDDGYLHPVVVTNTPVDDKLQTNGFGFSYTYNKAKNINLSNINPNMALPNDLINWIYGPNGTSINRIRTSMGNHNIPEPFLAGSARLYKEFVHYFGFDWDADLPASFQVAGFDYAADTPDLLAKSIRHQISLNTCQGCHGGENKTSFTQIFPRGYGEEANYWDPMPTVVANNHYPFFSSASIDIRFDVDVNNSGVTSDNLLIPPYLPTLLPNLNRNDKTTNVYNQVVSPFLTGRIYLGNSYWQDDEPDDNLIEGSSLPTNHILADDKLTGLYYVNDPSNDGYTITLPNGKGGNFPQLHTQRWGFNDLERRRIDLCKFLQNDCHADASIIDIIAVLDQIKHIPLPQGGH